MPAKRQSSRFASRPKPESQASSDDDFEASPPAPKRRKTSNLKGAPKKPSLHARLFGAGTENSLPDLNASASSEPCPLPSRQHDHLYHLPLLLHRPGHDAKQGRAALLKWFDSVSQTRKMPWRKPFLSPMGYDSSTQLRADLERRAYEVWISEIMLQQTRVATVIGYWNKWMAKWPTIHDLAKANEDEVRSVWQGLGYYSRGTRILEAAKLITSDEEMRGLLPQDVEALIDKVPGVGRYTAGAICSIVYGKPAPMVDGNVLRVLSRQLGVYADVQKNKASIDLLWAAAEALVKAAANDEAQEYDESPDGNIPTPPPSDVPGRWGQALMELGSTVCTPAPNCDECPIQSTCRVYSEARAQATKSTKVQTGDIEDACTLCEAFEDTLDEETVEKAPLKNNKKESILRYMNRGSVQKSREEQDALDKSLKKTIPAHVKRFPLRIAKKPVRVEETLVCAIKGVDGKYLLSQRPDKGLLAGLWEFPSRILEDPDDMDEKTRSSLAREFACAQVGGAAVQHRGELGNVPWLFSHIKLTMHVHLFEVAGKSVNGAVADKHKDKRLWVDECGLEGISMGTGMKKCWDLVQAV